MAGLDIPSFHPNQEPAAHSNSLYNHMYCFSLRVAGWIEEVQALSGGGSALLLLSFSVTFGIYQPSQLLSVEWATWSLARRS